MAVDHSGQAFVSGSADCDLTITISGNLLIAVVCVDGGPADLLASVVLDPSGNNESLTRVTYAGNGNIYGYIYYLVDPTTGSNLTLRAHCITSGVNVSLSAIDCSGMDTVSITDGYGVGTGTSSAPSTTYSPANDGGEVLAGMMSEANSGAAVNSWSGVTGQTTLDATDRGSIQTASAYANDTASGSLTTDFSTTQSDVWVCPSVCAPVAAAAGDAFAALAGNLRKRRFQHMIVR